MRGALALALALLSASTFAEPLDTAAPGAFSVSLDNAGSAYTGKDRLTLSYRRDDRSKLGDQ